jgi:hypothetical protein
MRVRTPTSGEENARGAACLFLVRRASCFVDAPGARHSSPYCAYAEPPSWCVDSDAGACGRRCICMLADGCVDRLTAKV